MALASLTGVPISGALVGWEPPYSWWKAIVFSGVGCDPGTTEVDADSGTDNYGCWDCVPCVDVAPSVREEGHTLVLEEGDANQICRVDTGQGEVWHFDDKDQHAPESVAS